MSEANKRQVGGDHYQFNGGAEQHWDRQWRMWGAAWFVGNITKYVERYQSKDGVKDLEKAKHYLEKLIELEKESEQKSKEVPTLTRVTADELQSGRWDDPETIPADRSGS